MGSCLKKFTSKIKPGSAIKKLDQVSKLLESMASRYRSEMRAIAIDKSTMARSEIINRLRRRKMIERSLQQTEDKLAVLFQKRLLLESLDVTKMQINALRKTSRAVAGFTSLHDVDKIDALKDQLEEMTEAVMDMNEMLCAETAIEIDENEILEELNLIMLESTMPEPPKTKPSTEEHTSEDMVSIPPKAESFESDEVAV